MTMDSLWRKYRLSAEGAYTLMYDPLMGSAYTDEEHKAHLLLVEMCHCAVASYLENNPEIEAKYLAKEPGCLYYDILRVAAPDWEKKASAWAADFTKRLEKRRAEQAEWEKKYIHYYKEAK